jgi:dipeptidase E
MRLYLSSFRLGNRPEELRRLVDGRRVAVIANADDAKDAAGRVASYAREEADLRSLGLEPAELDLRVYFGRVPQNLSDRLATTDLLWVRGGNAFILRRAFRQSSLDTLLPDLLANGLVYGGYSAGGAVLAPSLRGVELVDDPHDVPPDYDEEVVWTGLGIVPYGFVPHYRSEHPESPAIERVMGYLIDNHEPFVALRDGEALVLDGERRLVVG